MLTDAEIVRLSLEAPEAFGEIFERHYTAVANYTRRRLGSQVGDDIAAQAFVVAFERRRRFDLGFGNARPWLLGIAGNLVRHYLRDERVHAAALGRVPIEPPHAPIDDPDRMDAIRLRPVLASALLVLSEDDRETFLLVALGELSYEDAALALGIPIGTVRSRLHRARLLLRERMGDLAAMTEERTQDTGTQGGDRD